MVPASVPWLVLPSQGRRYPLTDGLTIGRAPDNGVLLEAASVSARHAAFHKIGEGWMVLDLGSTNGTFVNGVRIQGRASLADGDSLRLGNVEVQVEGLTARQEESRTVAPPPLPAPMQPPPLPPAFPPALPLAPPPLPMAVRGSRTKPKSRKGLWVAMAACLLLFLAGGWLLWGQLRPGGGLPGILAFRAEAGRDPRAAFAGALAPKRLTELNQVLWPTVEPEAGWTYFFRTCLVTRGARNGGREAVLFYHPWSDTALVTQWQDQKQLLDLEMVPGKALREGGALPYGGALGWTRLGAYAPPAVGMVTAQTLKAFETSFATNSALETALPWLAKAQAREACRVACSLQYAQVVQSLATFSASYDQPARLAYIRLLAMGDAALAKAPGTPADSAKALKDLPSNAWSGFQPTALVDTENHVLVMAHHRESPDLFLGVVFRRDGAELVPERLDLLSFNACYGALK